MSKIDNILASVDLMSIVPSESNLKSVGRDRWRGKCPIGNHSDGGFSVTVHRDGHKIFQCFACGKRGSVIDLFAALNGLPLSESIRKLSEGKKYDLSNDDLLRMRYESWLTSQPSFAWLVCDDCGARKKLDSSLDFYILCGLGSWLWDVCRDGSARCIKCRRLN